MAFAKSGVPTASSYLDQGRQSRSGLLFNALAMVAEFETDLIRLRTRGGMRVAKAKGRLRSKQPRLNTLYTVDDVLGPAEAGARRILMVSGLEEAYFTQLARIVMTRQKGAGDLTLGWDAQGAQSISERSAGLAATRRCPRVSPVPQSTSGWAPTSSRPRSSARRPRARPGLDAVPLASGWSEDRLRCARDAYDAKDHDPVGWANIKAEYRDWKTVPSMNTNTGARDPQHTPPTQPHGARPDT